MSQASTYSSGSHWLVRKQHQFRTMALAGMFTTVVLNLWGQPVHMGLWVYLVTQLLIYPHVLLVLAHRAPNPIEREIQHLLLDAFSLGLCAAVLGLPSFLTFVMVMGTSLNSAFNKGWRGSVKSCTAFALGVFTWWATGWLTWVPDANWPSTLFCMSGMLVYVLGMGDVAHIRMRQLRQARLARETSGQALEQANEALREQIEEISRLQEQLREQVHRDPLTGQYNRRYLDATLQREMRRCARESAPLSLLMMDIDHFKSVNDTHGHLVGDEVLRQIGLILATHARSHDVVCRYGGEEFLLMLPQLPLTQALQRAEQLRRVVQQHAFLTDGGDIHVTLSVGVAAFPENGQTVDELLRNADHALYQAKREGRNRVVQAADLAPATPTQALPPLT